MRIMVAGASKGLGKAFVEGLGNEGDHIIGVSRTRPETLNNLHNANIDWITADLSKPLQAIDNIERHTPEQLDVLIYNLGIWEERAFEDDYCFLNDRDDQIVDMVNTNVTSAILLLKRLMPRLLISVKPQIFLIGSTSGLHNSGRPEVTFSATKHALRGIADALRESYRDNKLSVTCLQLGYLNTEDPIETSVVAASERGEGSLIPVHDVVLMTRAILSLSPSAYVKELIMPAIKDERF